MPEIQTIALDQLLPYPNNPRTHPPANVKKLAASLSEYGWTSPVLVSATNQIIAGHGRVLAAKALGLADAPCIRLDQLTPAQVRAYRLADNRLGLDSDWNMDLLKLELSELDLDSALTGFDDPELDRILNSAPLAGEDDLPPLEEQPIAQPGEIWQLGPHRLLCGDATNAADIERLLAGVCPALMVTDPPYGVQYEPAWRNQEKLRFMLGKSARVTKKPDNDARADWTEAWQLFPGAVAYVWHAALRSSVVAESLLSCGFEIRSQIIWAKQHFTISRAHYHWQHEPCWYVVRGTANWHGGHTQTTIWQIANMNPFGGQKDDQFVFSVQKPVECMRRPILNHTNTGQAVYDPFMGSGTTIIASETTSRVCYGVELNPLYVDMAIRRWQTFSGKQALRASDNQPF